VTRAGALAGRILRGILFPLTWSLLAIAQWFARRRWLPARVEWRLKCWFFALVGPLVRNTVQYREFLDARAWRAAAAAAAAAQAEAEERAVPRIEIAPGDPERDDVLVFGIIDWHFRFQRPQHLATALARRGHRVFYFTPGFIADGKSGYHVERLDGADKLYQVRLHAPPGLSIYAGVPSGDAGELLAAGARAFLGAIDLRPCWTIVTHPGWRAIASAVPRSLLAYDCMDNHHGFATADDGLHDDERRLLRDADLLVVTSAWLWERLAPQHPHTRLIRNGCDHAHFADAPPRAPNARPVIGYFGAMAEWFDAALVRAVAHTFAECDVLLVGADTAGVARALRGLPNVRMLGEVPYAELAQHVHAMDVCLIPFVIDDLTRATNPVKAYEALAAGKPVVATPMPELQEACFDGLVRTAEAGQDFLAEVALALREARDPELVARRRAFAVEQTWEARCDALVEAMASVPQPRASVVIVTWNNAHLTRRCLDSILGDPARPELEVIVVDNASRDDTLRMLAGVCGRDPRVQVIANSENRGFAAAVNQGLARATGELLVVLNNDTVVTPGWLRTFQRHLRNDPRIGLIGPITNNIGNEARVVTAYQDLEEMQEEQVKLTGRNAGIAFDIKVLAFLCVAMPREVYERIGPLDEAFGVGFFEDDDYCMRVRAAGYRIACAEDVFIHHELSASFQKVDRSARDALFARNRAYFESKWGPWTPHVYRKDERSTA
jgi:GT2 family glycosyltransferase/glycosyltransferase involved in cell wall biosynthesis